MRDHRQLRFLFCEVDSAGFGWVGAWMGGGWKGGRKTLEIWVGFHGGGARGEGRGVGVRTMCTASRSCVHLGRCLSCAFPRLAGAGAG